MAPQQQQQHQQQHQDKQPFLSKSFIDDYKSFAYQFEHIAQDLFRGEELEQLVKRFLHKHEQYLKRFPYSSEYLARQRLATNSDQVIDEDLQIIISSSGSHCCEDELATLISRHDLNEQLALVDKLIDLNQTHRILADVYRRACGASYLRVTHNKSRKPNRDDDEDDDHEEDDCMEPVSYGRQAIRYDPRSFHAFYAYTIALGWYLDALGNPREKVLQSRVFMRAAQLCTRLNPRDPLAHHLLGRYYYNVAALSWLERTLAKQLVGCKLEGSYDAAEAEFLKAHQMIDTWLATGLWLARCKLAQRRPMHEVSEWIEFGLKQARLDPSTELEARELFELRAKLRRTDKLTN